MLYCADWGSPLRAHRGQIILKMASNTLEELTPGMLRNLIEKLLFMKVTEAAATGSSVYLRRRDGGRTGACKTRFKRSSSV